jgi:hypothetical protein
VDGDAPQPLVDALIALMPWAVWTLSRAVRCKQWDIARELIDAQRKPAPRRAQCKRATTNIGSIQGATTNIGSIFSPVAVAANI